MVKLKQFLASMPPSERDRFASRCGTSVGYLRNVGYGYRTAGEKLCASIERESNHAITRRDLRPHDWQDIWPELIKEAN